MRNEDSQKANGGQEWRQWSPFEEPWAGCAQKWPKDELTEKEQVRKNVLEEQRETHT